MTRFDRRSPLSSWAAGWAEGWTADGTRIATSWRGIVQRLEAKMRGFRLSPIGREITAPVPQAVDPFAEFDQPLQ